MPARARGAATTLIRAAFVLPVSQPVIENGAVLVRGDRLQTIGSWRELSKTRHDRAVDLGDVILLPGLVNAHCHLDYTHMAGQFPPPRVFVDWLKLITEAKSGWGREEYIQSWLDGAQMLTRSGTTLVGDIEAVPAILAHCRARTPLRVLSFLEMIGITNRRSPESILDETLKLASECRRNGLETGLSPHAPYSTTPQLLRLTAAETRTRRTRVCIHVAESSLEYEMFSNGRGAMHEWISRSGRDMSDCGTSSPVRHLEGCGLLGKEVLLAHGNYLGRGDAELLSRSGTHVVHCPRSHFYFGHEPFSLRRLHRAGVNICLGTDSLASVYRKRRQPVELNMFEEMRALQRAHPSLPARRILQMATLNGARALGLGGETGELTPGASADLITVHVQKGVGTVYDQVLAHKGAVHVSMIRGAWIIAPEGAA